MSVIFVTFCNSSSSRLRFTDLSQLMLMDNFTFIFSHFLANMLTQLGSHKFILNPGFVIAYADFDSLQ